MNGDGEAPQFTDAVGKTVPRPFVPPQVASPINLLNPDRYEFYTFNDSGDLVKRLMTLKEIQSIVANGNGAMIGDNEPDSQSVVLNSIPLSNQGAETKVQDIVDNVQNVLSREMENNKNSSQIPSQLLDTPDVSSSWSMILPAIFGNTGGEILPHKPINMTPETEIEDTTTTKIRKTTTKTPSKIVPSTKAPPKTTQTSATTATKVQSTIVSTNKQTVKENPKPTLMFRSTTTEEPIEALTEVVTVAPTKKQTIKVKPRPTITYRSTTTERPTEQTTTEKVKDLTTEVVKETTTESVTTTSTEKPTSTSKTTVKVSTVAATTSEEVTREVTAASKIETVKVKPKPTITYRSTTEPSTLALIETTTEEVTKITKRPSTSKITPTKKIVKKPTVSSYKRPMTNSPIIIEKIPKKPNKQTTSQTKTQSTSQMKTERSTQKPSTTVEMKAEALTKSSVSIAPSTTVTKKITEVTRTEAPTTTTQQQTSTEMPKVQSTTRKSVTETTQMMMEPTTLSASEEDRQDSAINQIIGSLQSDFFTNYEKITTIAQPDSEAAASDLAMEKTGDLVLVPDKVFLSDELIIDEAEPVIKDLPSSTTLSDEVITTDPPATFEKLEVTTSNSKLQEIPLENSEIMQTIEQLIKDQAAAKLKQSLEKLDILGFDDDDETEIKIKDTLESKKNLTQSEFITKAATVASILSTKIAEQPTTTVTPLEEESDTTVPTILSEALAHVIHLMKSELESKRTTAKPLEETAVSKPINASTHEQILNKTSAVYDEPSGLELSQLLHHYEVLNSQDQLEAFSMLSETTAKTLQPTEVEATTILPIDEKTLPYETTIVRETSSVSIKTGNSEEKKTTAMENDVQVSTTEASSEEFSTFFFIDNDQDEATLDPLNDELGEFTTEQYVNTEKQIMDRKDEFSTTQSPEDEARIESEEESVDIFSDVLNAIGIANDEEDEPSFKIAPDSQESDEVESAISSLSSTIDGTLATDVKTDFTLTSKIASSLISVADTLTETLNDEDESEEVTTSIPTTEVPIVKEESTTAKLTTTESIPKTTERISTEKAEEASTTIKQVVEETTKKQEVNKTEQLVEATDASIESAIDVQEPVEMKTERDVESPMVPLSIVRKDNSLEEIDFITPSTPTSTRIPITEGNFIRIESIETTMIPKLSGFKNKGQEVHEHIKPIYIALRSTTTEKSTSLPKKPTIKPTITADQTTVVEETIFTERVPLIEFTKPASTVDHLSSTEDNLVEIKIQKMPTISLSTKKPPVTSSSTTEKTQSTLPQLRPNSQTIKNTIKNAQQQVRPPAVPIDLSSTPGETLGLAASTANLNNDLRSFSKLCNELAFSFWKSITADGISQSRSVIISPFALTSFLSMIFLGARGQTSGEMNDLLRLDDMVSFNPHVVFRNISESIEQTRTSGIAAAAFVRELYSDRSKGKLLPYFKEKAQQYYGAHVEEVNFNVINDILRRRTNLLVKRHTFSKINEYLKTNNIWVSEPLAAVSANVFLVS